MFADCSNLEMTCLTSEFFGLISVWTRKVGLLGIVPYAKFNLTEFIHELTLSLRIKRKDETSDFKVTWNIFIVKGLVQPPVTVQKFEKAVLNESLY